MSDDGEEKVEVDRSDAPANVAEGETAAGAGAATSPSLLQKMPWLLPIVGVVVAAAIAVAIAVPLTQNRNDNGASAVTSAAAPSMNRPSPSMQPTELEAPTVPPSTSMPMSRPTHPPSTQPSTRPSTQPSMHPSTRPSTHPSTIPSTRPSTQPSPHPSVHPSVHPSTQPSTQPSSSPADETVIVWETTGQNGLSLQVINALDDKWQDTFALSFADWSNGVPNALDLSTNRITAPTDSSCDSVLGMLKICNGDYGDTRWRGINEVFLANGFIISSVARLNDFYLELEDVALRRFTMCHQIGHAFGLPHTDEEFFNEDLGNCLDYTSNPEANQRPDETNFNRLVELYGEFTSERRNLAGISGNANRPPALSHYENAIEGLLKQSDGIGGVDQDKKYEGWNVLHRNEIGTAFEKDLGDGFTLQAHVLRVP